MADRFEVLEARVRALENRLAGPATVQDGPLWVLDGLRSKVKGSTGGVVFAGIVQPRDEDARPENPARPVEWQYGRTVDDLMMHDWSDSAGALAALGHPVRLDLLRRVLAGITATRDLVETDGLGTSGQLHHHLRALVAAGWLRQRQRGDYEVPGARVIPLLAIITAAAGA